MASCTLPFYSQFVVMLEFLTQIKTIVHNDVLIVHWCGFNSVMVRSRSSSYILYVWVCVMIICVVHYTNAHAGGCHFNLPVAN